MKTDKTDTDLCEFINPHLDFISPLTQIVLDYLIVNVIAIKNDGTRLFKLQNNNQWKQFCACIANPIFGNLFQDQDLDLILKDWCFHSISDLDQTFRRIHLRRHTRCLFFDVDALQLVQEQIRL